MARYISQHTLACLTRQGAEELGKRIAAASAVTAKRVLVNMQEGKMMAEFEAASREELEKWFAAEKFHFDWILRLSLSLRRACCVRWAEIGCIFWFVRPPFNRLLEIRK